MNMFDLSIVIVNYNTAQLTKDCITSIKKFTKNIKYEIILIDNASSEGIQVEGLKIIKNKENVGFGGANNQGIKLAKGRYILFLNSDTLLIENSLEKLVEWMDEKPGAGALTSGLLDKNKNLQTNGGDFPNLARVFIWATFLDDIPGLSRIFGSYHLSVEVPISNSIYKFDHKQGWISGAVFLIR